MSTSTLTERYVHEVARRIPADQRDDVADELRTTIADTVEARESSDPDAAEREVLTEMGDPIRLAARYADRPLSLIGPELLPTYLRLLVFLLSAVLPLFVAATVLLDVLDNKDAGSAIGAGIGTVFNVGGQMVAWTTALFALADRVRERGGTVHGVGGTWSPDDLPEPRRSDGRSMPACATAVWDALLIGLIVWQQVAEPYRVDGTGDRVAVLDPDLWTGWIWPVLAGLAGLVALQVIRIARRGWTTRLAVLHAAASAVYALPLAWIVHRHEFFNPDFAADVTVHDSFYTAATLGVLAVAGIEVVKRFRDARG